MTTTPVSCCICLVVVVWKDLRWRRCATTTVTQSTPSPRSTPSPPPLLPLPLPLLSARVSNRRSRVKDDPLTSSKCTIIHCDTVAQMTHEAHESLSAALSAAADRDQQRLEWFHCLQYFSHLESLRPEAVLSAFFATARAQTSGALPILVPTQWPELLQKDSPVRDAIRRVITENIETTLPGFNVETSAGTRPLPFPRSYCAFTTDGSLSRWLSAGTRCNGRFHVSFFYFGFLILFLTSALQNVFQDVVANGAGRRH